MLTSSLLSFFTIRADVGKPTWCSAGRSGLCFLPSLLFLFQRDHPSTFHLFLHVFHRLLEEKQDGQFSLIIKYLPQTEEEQPGSVYILLLFVDLLLPPVTSDPGTAAVTLGCHLET